MLVWSIATNFMIPYELRASYNMPSDIVLYLVILIYYFVPHNLIKKSENGYKFSLIIRLFGMVGTMILCCFRNGKEGNNMLYVFVSMINFDLMFMAQGVIDQVYHKE